MGLAIKTYKGFVTGYDHEEVYFAASRGKAMSKMFRAVQICEHALTYKNFLQRATMHRCEAPPRFGAEIIVGGERAYFISHASHENYVRFARPDSDTVLMSHPLDVEFPTPKESK